MGGDAGPERGLQGPSSSIQEPPRLLDGADVNHFAPPSPSRHCVGKWGRGGCTYYCEVEGLIRPGGLNVCVCVSLHMGIAGLYD